MPLFRKLSRKQLVTGLVFAVPTSLYGSAFVYLALRLKTGDRISLEALELAKKQDGDAENSEFYSHVRRPLVQKFVDFYQPHRRSRPFDVNIFTPGASFIDPGIAVAGHEEIEAILPKAKSWFSSDTRATVENELHLVDQAFLAIRQHFVISTPFFSRKFHMDSCVWLTLEGPPGGERIATVNEEWFGIPLIDISTQRIFRRVNGLISVWVKCGTDRFIGLKYLFSS